MTDSAKSLPALPDSEIGTVVMQIADGTLWRCYHSPKSIITTRQLDEVIPALSEIENKVSKGYHAAGFISYEATPAFDPAMKAFSFSPVPLLWFGIYDQFEERADLLKPQSDHVLLNWLPSITSETYEQSLRTIHDLIASGETYQVNYTYRLRSQFAGSAWQLFLNMMQAQECKYGAFLNTGDHRICSASPELFFKLTGTQIECRPMKGTLPRGRWRGEDRQNATKLQQSEKDRAENVMIVDMIRNDLGRIAEAGSVQVPKLFEVERFPTVWQMISQITAQTTKSFTEILSALFPCASITGAPKIRTTQIISELETDPRGIYTGAIGYLAPDHDAQFNVAIRTATVDPIQSQAEYGTGGGIVWDSKIGDEYQESLTKALVVTQDQSPFQLLETILWTKSARYFLLEYHLKRLAASASYFGYPFYQQTLENELMNYARSLGDEYRIVRILLDRSGQIHFQSKPYIPEKPKRRWNVALSSKPVDSNDRFLFHKTTHRKQYEQALREYLQYDDVVLWNDRGEITESTRANVVVKIDNVLYTPPISCGLLAGTFREHLLEIYRVRERVITKAEWFSATSVYLINSVRGWIPVSRIEEPHDPV